MEVIEKWCCCLPSNLKNSFNELLISETQLPILKNLRELLKKEAPWVFEDNEALATAAFTQIGIYLYSLLHASEYVEEADAFVALYVNLDYALDGNMKEDVKKIIIREINDYLQFGSENATNRYSVSSINLIKIIQRKCSIPTLRKCFQEEIKSSVLQRNCDEKSDLYKICHSKSKVCIDVISEIMNIQETHAFELGLCIQLFDDLFDLDIDEREGNNTYALCLKKNLGCVDEVIFTILGIVDTLPYISVKIFFSYAMIIYSQNSPWVSEDLKKEWMKYYPFSEVSSESRIKKWCSDMMKLDE